MLIRFFKTLTFSAFLLALLLSITLRAHAQTSGAVRSPGNLITFDASQTLPPPQPLLVKLGGRSPNNHEIGINSRFLTKDGEPWLPVMGEFHFSRYPEAEWEDELLKMKAAGIQIVATYIFWIHHEEFQGKFDWSGQRDLRRFVELCGKHDLFVVVRPGPYAHGEVRNGGLPDWVVKASPTRRNDPVYLQNVRSYFSELGHQLHGLFWKEGGPIIGIQLENEYFSVGPDAGAAHISKLKKIAQDSGMDAPLFTVTGWGHAEFPNDEVVPVFGVYPDAFWESDLKPLPPSPGYLFDFSRNLDIPPAASKADTPNSANPSLQYPLLLAEAGGGMQVAYHRRPAISADDVAALAITHLGAGANLYGYYMFQGGANPVGRNSTLQESAAIDHVYDLPVISYDFQSPLGQYGQLRSSYRYLKLLHYFLADFGSLLAPMVAYPPQRRPSGPEDRNTPRSALRSDGTHGFLFFNNYLRDYPMAEQKGLQFQVKLAAETLTFPRTPVDIPKDSYFVWPLNLSLGSINLRYSTAQLLCTIQDKSVRYYFFFALAGIAPEFSFDSASAASVEAFSGNVHTLGMQTIVDELKPGTGEAIRLKGKDGSETHIVLLTLEQARNIWRDSSGRVPGLLLSQADVFFKAGSADLRATAAPRMEFGVFPGRPVEPSPEIRSLQDSRPSGIFTQYRIEIPVHRANITWDQSRAADPSQPVAHGEYNAIAPTDAAFASAGSWQIHIPASSLRGLEDLFLRINYTGDVARLYESNTLLDDNFYNGAPWEIGLKRFIRDEKPHDFVLKITPLRKDAPIFLPSGAWPEFDASSEIAAVHSIGPIAEYETVIYFKP